MKAAGSGDHTEITQSVNGRLKKKSSGKAQGALNDTPCAFLFCPGIGALPPHNEKSIRELCFLRYMIISSWDCQNGRRLALLGGSATLLIHRNLKRNLGKEG